MVVPVGVSGGGDGRRDAPNAAPCAPISPAGGVLLQVPPCPEASRMMFMRVARMFI